MQKTKLENWRLNVFEGAQNWEYLESEHDAKDKPQNDCEKYWLGLLKPKSKLNIPCTAGDAAKNCMSFLANLQTSDGHFAGEYGGPLFLIPFFAISFFATGAEWKKPHQIEMRRYVASQQNFDGGWGLHIESPSNVFGTILNYVSLRILGLERSSSVCQGALNWINSNYDATFIPTWGKFWLAAIDLYSWEGIHSIPPELLLLPEWVPIQPKNMWCHSRQVYLSMSYIYARRWKRPACPLVNELRNDIYPNQVYSNIIWAECRSRCSPLDLVHPHSTLYKLLCVASDWYEKLPNFVQRILRNKALTAAENLIDYEDKATDFLCLGPVNKAGNLVAACIMHGPDSKQFERHVARMYDFMWMTSQGMLVNGTNGSQLWDTSFIIQAVAESNLVGHFSKAMASAFDFVNQTQIQEDLPAFKDNHRHSTKGAWPFSTRAQGYTVSDCTAEGLISALALQCNAVYKEVLNEFIPESRFRDAVDLLLGMQNKNGGFASYEQCRGFPWVEELNGIELFCNIMVEYTYVECTASVCIALAKFRQSFPDYRSQAIDSSISRAVAYIISQQREDGGFYGSWAVCFTYATWLALEALAVTGLDYRASEPVRRACKFLLRHQNSADGGWGEHYTSCEKQEYVPHPDGSQVVNTSWALLGLMAAKCPDYESILDGVKFLVARQQSDGSYKQEGIEGVFNKTCMISYPNYKFTFPIWAFGRFSEMYHHPEILANKQDRVPSFINSQFLNYI